VWSPAAILTLIGLHGSSILAQRRTPPQQLDIAFIIDSRTDDFVVASPNDGLGTATTKPEPSHAICISWPIAADDNGATDYVRKRTKASLTIRGIANTTQYRPC